MLIYSFDCAQHNMGFTAVRYNAPLKLEPFLNENKSIDKKISWLETAVDTFVKNVFRLVCIEKAQLIDLGDNPILGLRIFLDTLAAPDAVVYEFQMNINDKARMISNMIHYHYIYAKKIIRIGGAEKNKVCFVKDIDEAKFVEMCPNLAKKRKTLDGVMSTIKCLLFYKPRIDLSHRNFLRITNKNYDGNKLHTSALFEYWNNAFNLGYDFAKWDDVADSFIQCLAVLKDLLHENVPC